jgi:hypothetical protein
MTYAALELTLPEISIEQLKAAIAVGLYAAEGAKVLVDTQNATLRPESELEPKFLKWIEENDGAKKRYMQQTLSKLTGGCEEFTVPVASSGCQVGCQQRLTLLCSPEHT